MKTSEGYIKFNCVWENKDISFLDDEFLYLNGWRNHFFRLNLIGAYPNGIGYGNISIRYQKTNSFIISGSSTGHISSLSRQDYSLVSGYDFKKNVLFCTGKVKASSESLSHAAIYESGTNINAVIHIHHQKLYTKLKGRIDTTNDEVEYGTSEMAEEIKRIISKYKHIHRGIIAMGGHKAGLLAYGASLDIAGCLLLDKFKICNIKLQR